VQALSRAARAPVTSAVPNEWERPHHRHLAQEVGRALDAGLLRLVLLARQFRLGEHLLPLPRRDGRHVSPCGADLSGRRLRAGMAGDARSDRDGSDQSADHRRRFLGLPSHTLHSRRTTDAGNREIIG
jgi:hypothetical protein